MHWSIAAGGSKSHANPISTVLFVAQLRAGGVASITTTVCVHLALLMQPSSASQVRVTEKVPPQKPTAFVVVLITATVLYLSGFKWMRRANLACLGMIFVAQTIAIPIQFWQIPERLPFRVALGSETSEAFLSRAIDAYPAAQYINRTFKPGEKVVGFGVEQVRFYLNARMASPFQDDLNQWQVDTPAPALSAYLIATGYTYVLAERPNPPKYFLSQDFLNRFSTIEFTAQRVDVYHVSPIPMDNNGANLLNNPGFETLTAANWPADWEPYGRPFVVMNPSQAHTGKVAVQATARDGFTTRFPVQPGEIYLLGHWSRAEQPQQLGRLQINWLSASGQMVDVSIDAFEADETWSWHQFFAMAPTGASFAHIYVSVHGESKIWFDDYVFRKTKR